MIQVGGGSVIKEIQKSAGDRTGTVGVDDGAIDIAREWGPGWSKGNTKFFRNETMPEGIEFQGFDRVVYEPEIPI